MSAIYDLANETSVMYDCPYRRHGSYVPPMAIPHRLRRENQISREGLDLRLSTLNISY
ncbi:hypothetical protein ALQ65_200170 [Pseudomonas syringae pv. coriandricola]|uniref:Uncharacterized protein n=1 Tax=Pseudomonas syringae pv. coriandricola TaxID=264453 RepID=A0A3M3JAX3_9PSED|nr:hypothetical protein ALQ65_200170 [Pseudomonas syringae pv. coriandricola]